MRELFQTLVTAARTGEDSTFPSLDLVNMYGIEGPYQISFFCRALSNFQRDVNDVLLNHGIFDEVVSGAYGDASVVKSRLVLSPMDITGNLYVENHNGQELGRHPYFVEFKTPPVDREASTYPGATSWIGDSERAHIAF